MTNKRICICGAQVPFARGGAELLVESLSHALLKRGYEVDVVNVPFKWYPKEEVITHALAWRLLDLQESNGRPIDLVIGTKFPSYLIRHTNKVVWLVHQFRQAYDLYGTQYSSLGRSEDDLRTRDMVVQMDNQAFREALKVFTISQNVSQRLSTFNGVDSAVLYPPPPREGAYRCDTYGDFILSVGRLDSMKRTSLLIEALAHAPEAKAVIVGGGPERDRLQQLAGKLGVEGRVRFCGYVEDDVLLDLYANCLAVFYAPFDEDYGYVPLEAFGARKPVITTSDAGGPLEIVLDGYNGYITLPDPTQIAGSVSSLYASKKDASRLGEAGWEATLAITWDKVLDALVN